MRNPNASSVPFADRASRFLSLAAAMILTAHAEHELAVAIGIDDILAWLFPICLDLYAAAFRAHARRDIGAAIGLMIGCQTLAHLIAAGMITPAWWLIIPVSAVVPIVLWRGHTLSGTKPTEPSVDTAAVDPATPAVEPVSAPAVPAPVLTVHTLTWPTVRTETTLADIAAAPTASPAPEPAADPTVKRSSANQPQRKTREQRVADLNALILKHPTVDQGTAARDMGVSTRYIRGLIPGAWDDYRTSIATAV